MRPFTKYVFVSLALLFFKGTTAFSSAHPEDDEGQSFVNNIVAVVSGQIPLEDAVSQGVLYAFHTLYPKGESLKVPAADETTQPSTSTSSPVRDDAPQVSTSSPLPTAFVALSPALVSLHRQVERYKGICQDDLSIDNMSSFLASGANLLDGILDNLISLNAHIPGSDTKTTFRAALITALLKRNLMPSQPLAEACVPGEYLGGLMPTKHTSARNYAAHRKGFSLELIRHKNACLAQYGTWTNQLRCFEGLEYKSPERVAFDELHRYFTRLWDAFFTVERVVRDVGLTLHPEDLFYGLLENARLLHWTANSPAFAQKFIQTWDTLFIYYTHHLLANAENPALDKIPALLTANQIDLARVNAQPYTTEKATPLFFIQAPHYTPLPQLEEGEAIDENTVSIKEGETSSEEGNEGASSDEDSSDEDAGLDTPSAPNERTPLYPSVLLPETASTTLRPEQVAFNAFEATGMPPQDPKALHAMPTSSSTLHLPSCWEVLGVDPEWDLSDLCQDDQTGEEGDIPQKDEYNGTND